MMRPVVVGHGQFDSGTGYVTLMQADSSPTENGDEPVRAGPTPRGSPKGLCRHTTSLAMNLRD